jgi:hypothetical protein
MLQNILEGNNIAIAQPANQPSCTINTGLKTNHAQAAEILQAAMNDQRQKTQNAAPVAAACLRTDALQPARTPM